MKILKCAFQLSIVLASVNMGVAQAHYDQGSNERLSPAEFRQLATTCAPNVPLITLRAIVRAESGFRPYALSLDYPRRTAREQGLTDGSIVLAHQPRNASEAKSWAHWFLKQHRSISVGLAQVSTQHTASLGLTVDQLFDPCTNIQAAAQLLTAKYRDAVAILGEGAAALDLALSEYNSGSGAIGFENGYVMRVVSGEFSSKQP